MRAMYFPLHSHLRRQIFFRLFVLLTAMVCLLSSAPVRGEGNTVSPVYGPLYRFPLTDIPYNARHGYDAPGMEISLYLCKNPAQAVHRAIDSAMQEYQQDCMGRIATAGLLVLFDVAWTYLPPGYGWLHEEGHRAVLKNRGINSFNDIYKMKLLADYVSVSRVKDEDLVRLKREYPADMVRLSAAGNEMQLVLVSEMQKDTFFSGRRSFPDRPSWWINTLNAVFYIDYCTRSDADRDTEQFEQEEGSRLSVRDAVGLDFTAWVYDLFRPEEPYEERGPHPSGAGLRRYIKRSDLTAAELRYLKQQRNLSLLNLISPLYLGKDRFRVENPFSGKTFYWNFLMSHHLTSFGYAVDFCLLLRQGGINLVAVSHNYANRQRYFPGAGLELRRYPAKPAGISLYLSPGIDLWQQPAGQMFRDENPRPGGLLKMTADIPVARCLEIFLRVEGKTEGWYAGCVSLDREARLLTGLNLIL